MLLACVAGAKTGDWGEKGREPLPFSPQSPLLATATQATMLPAVFPLAGWPQGFPLH